MGGKAGGMRAMDARQLPIPLNWRPAQGRRDFLVSDCNAQAVAQIDAWRDWPGRRLALVGEPRAGKTHLAHVWAEAVGARLIDAAALTPEAAEHLTATPVAIEDVDEVAELSARGRQLAEEGLFHLYNLLHARGLPLLATARTAPGYWRLALPDLASRLKAMPVVEIAPPDDALLSSVLVKLLSDRRLTANPKTVRFILTRMERSFAAAERIVDALDRLSLARRQAVTLPLAAEVMQNEGP